MKTPLLATLPYESWIVRRTSAGTLQVLYYAVACGPGDVLVPLPWPGARLLDETPSRSTFWTLWDFVMPWYKLPPGQTGIPAPPQGPRDPPSLPAHALGESVAALFRREELPPELASRIPETWHFAKSFLWWPAPRGLARWSSRLPLNRRKLAPVALTARGTSSPDETALPRVVLSVAGSGEMVDFYIIDKERLSTLPRYSRDFCPLGKGVTIPGWAETQDYVHWLREWWNPKGTLFNLQLEVDALRDEFEDTTKRISEFASDNDLVPFEEWRRAVVEGDEQQRAEQRQKRKQY